MQLPEQFLEKMKTLRGVDFEEYLKAMDDKPLAGLRINRNMINSEDFIKIAPYPVTPIPYIDNGFFVSENDGWSKHPYYFAGMYYLQEPSAMLPANRLPIDETDRVLDLCAAPGGKATELSTKTRTLLIANDISFSRTIPLVKNLEIFGSGNFLVLNEEPSKLAVKYRHFFDKILVDAPCSGEGMFRKDSNLIKSWCERGPEYYCDIQKSILSSAYEMLSDDGMILYSTCTFSPVEDEEIIIDFLKNHEDMVISDVEHYEGFSGCYEAYVEACVDSDKMVHIFPDKMQGEGHFLTLLRKKASDVSAKNAVVGSANSDLITYKKLPSEVKIFFEGMTEEYQKKLEDLRYIVKDKQMVFMLTDDMTQAYDKSLHFVRTGIYVGTLNGKGGFVPHTAFARCLKKSDFKNTLDLSSKETDVIRYLKGETIITDAEGIKKGYVLITTDGYSLGFAKYDGSKLKNLYEKGWRLL